MSDLLNFAVALLVMLPLGGLMPLDVLSIRAAAKGNR